MDHSSKTARELIADELFDLSIAALHSKKQISEPISSHSSVNTHFYRTGVQWVLDRVRADDSEDLPSIVEDAAAQAFSSKDPMIVSGALDAWQIAQKNLPDNATLASKTIASIAIEKIEQRSNEEQGLRRSLFTDIREMVDEFKGRDFSVLARRMQCESEFHQANRMNRSDNLILKETYAQGASIIDQSIQFCADIDFSARATGGRINRPHGQSLQQPSLM